MTTSARRVQLGEIDAASAARLLVRLRSAQLNGTQLDDASEELRTILENALVPHPAPNGSAPPNSEMGAVPPTAHRAHLSSKAVARRVGVTERAVRKAAYSGRLAGRLEDKQWLFTNEAVNEWERGRRMRTGALKAAAEEQAHADREAQQRYEAAESALAEVDELIRTQEQIRDQAEAEVAQLAGRGRSRSMWLRHEDDHAAAVAEIERLLSVRREKAAHRNRLAEAVAPIRQAERERERDENLLAGCEILAGIPALMTKVIAQVEAARPYLSRAGRRPSSHLERLTREWRDDGRGPLNMGPAARVLATEFNQADAKARLERLTP